jgi:hypothetical protein
MMASISYHAANVSATTQHTRFHELVVKGEAWPANGPAFNGGSGTDHALKSQEPSAGPVHCSGTM